MRISDWSSDGCSSDLCGESRWPCAQAATLSGTGATESLCRPAQGWRHPSYRAGKMGGAVHGVGQHEYLRQSVWAVVGGTGVHGEQLSYFIKLFIANVLMQKREIGSASCRERVCK